MPEIILVVFPYFLQIDDRVMTVNKSSVQNNQTVLSVAVEVLLIGEVLNLTYIAILNPDHQMESNTTNPVLVNYTTIKQEGIGLMVRFEAPF